MATSTASLTATSTAATNLVANIKNSLPFDVDIYDVFNNDPSGASGVLTYKKLGDTLKAGDTQDFTTIHTYASQLQAMRTGTIDALGGEYYRQFPVAVLAVSSFSTSLKFELTVNSQSKQMPTSQQGMEKTFAFIKYIQANPDSNLATNFRAALASKTDQTGDVNAFFAGKTDLKLCNIVTWSAVTAWQTQFTNAWQSTCYLYSVVEGDPSPTNTTSLIATVTITSNASDDQANLTLEGSSSNVALSMTGDGSMQEQKAGIGGSTAVSLTPVWMNVPKTSTDNPPVTTYVTAVGMVGTVNGKKVAGTLTKLDLSVDTPSEWQKLYKDFTDNLWQIIGTLTSVAILYVMAKQGHQSKMQKENQTETKDKSAEQVKQEKSSIEQADLNNPSVRNKASEVETIASTVPEKYTNFETRIDIIKQYKVINEQIDNLGEFLEVNAPDAIIESTAGTLMEARDANLNGDFITAQTKLVEVTTNITKALSDSSQRIKQENAKKVEEVREAVEEHAKVEKSIEEAKRERDVRNSESDPKTESEIKDRPELIDL